MNREVNTFVEEAATAQNSVAADKAVRVNPYSSPILALLNPLYVIPQS